MSNLIKLPAVIKITALSRSAIYQKIKDGQFPAQIKLGARAIAWPDDKIHGWVQEQIQRQ
ncbi:MAG: helix-turn-helix transcriptional regulator [Sulfuriferula sp.]